MKRDPDTILIELKQNKGRVLIETLATMLLLILLGVGCFSLTVSAIGAYQRLYTSKEKAAELRVASSFITTKIRQNDMSGCLEVKPDPVSENNALVIHEEIDDVIYTTWIFHSDGWLYETIVLSDESPTVDISQPIARIDLFEINYSQGEKIIYTKVGINGYKTYDSFIKLRSN